jgi:hypothetical protein
MSDNGAAQMEQALDDYTKDLLLERCKELEKEKRLLCELLRAHGRQHMNDADLVNFAKEFEEECGDAVQCSRCGLWGSPDEHGLCKAEGCQYVVAK